MKFNVAVPGNNHIPPTPEWVLKLTAPDYQRFAREVDAMGYHAITTSEHIVMPFETVPRLGPYWTHALTVMAFIAGATQRVRVDATVLVVPYHHPVQLAKVVATLDVLSGGRMTVSVGVGHAPQEFKVLGLPHNRRGKMTDEALEVMKVCWASEEPEFHGTFFDVSGVAFQPHPVQQPRPPIVVGGNSDAALQRAARYEGWQPNPTNFTREGLIEKLAYLRSLPDYQAKQDGFVLHGIGLARGVDPSISFGDLGRRAELRDQLVQAVGELADLGLTELSLPAIPSDSLDEHLDSLRWFEEEVASQFPD